MKNKTLIAALAVAGMVGVTANAQALVFGYYLSGASGSPAAAITAAGHTAQQLINLTAGDLVGIDVLWILNGNNRDPDANVMNNVANISSFVNGGGVLSFHDRNVNDGPSSASAYIAGAAGVTFVRDFNDDAEIEVLVTNTVTNGPGGVIDNTSLDGGSSSSHGYALLATLPAGATAVLSQGDATHIVDFYYSVGLGDVYYSTIPLDYYFGGYGGAGVQANMTQVYAVNEAAFQAELARGNGAGNGGGNGGNGVPEPGILGLLGLGIAALGWSRRKSA